jgi:predicted phosphodiesterase
MPTILCLSDMHGNLINIKKQADIGIIAGDSEPWHNHAIDYQEWWYVNRFIPWSKTLPISNIVHIAGNHSWLFEKKPGIATKLFYNTNITYLERNYDTIKDTIIYGVPDSLPFFDWAFNASEDKLRSIYSKIPNDVDVIISHGPPYGYGDLSTYSNNYGEHVGSRALLEKIIEIQPRLVVTGHIHAAYGIYEVGLTKVINCAIVNDEYKLVRGPIYVEL